MRSTAGVPAAARVRRRSRTMVESSVEAVRSASRPNVAVCSRRLASSEAPSIVLICQMLDELAQTPDRLVPTSEIVSHIGVSRDVLRGALGALTRHVKKHFRDLGWPMTMQWGGDLGDGHAMESYYSLSSENAREWKRARGES